MTAAEVFTLMIDEKEPAPVAEALDRIVEDVEGCKDVTDAVYEVFRAAGEWLLATLGPRPRIVITADFFNGETGRTAGDVLSAQHAFWEFAHGVAQNVRGNYRANPNEFQTLAGLLDDIPRQLSTSIQLAVHTMGFESWFNHLRRIDLILVEVEATEERTLSAPGTL